ncbi:transcriptional regulator [Thermococcus gorgonarius]|uniref:Transcriptional regulator n=2 Tax=Thermococcus gorgonarius TaxID=71997 RepID=A0A2Z2MAX5_THEGO|nr:transcriptional regulator [Thermococcus gorgonarius]
MRLSLSVLVMIIAGLLMAPVPVKGQTVSSLSLTVYEDGYVLVNETVLTANYTVVLDVPLLGQHVEGFIAVDENGELLPYEISGSNATIYFGNVSVVQISYFTPDITTKEGAVWTLSLESPVQVYIILPEDAIITDLSEVPLKIQDNLLVMPPGNISVSYVLQAKTSTGSVTSSSTTSSIIPGSGGGGSSTTPSPGGTGSGIGGKLVAAVIIGLVILGGLYAYLSRDKKSGTSMETAAPEALRKFREKIESMEDLNDDEKGALIYLVENGGKAPQSKVRAALGIPKTTAWRMFKRLEEKGLVRVYKLGRENWVELVLE